jgi:hypothetical protein
MRRSAQVPLQNVVPGAHRHAPETHSSSAVHARPQLPQLF